MAAYAALLSLNFIIDQIKQHPRPPISLHKQRLHSLTENISFLQKFLEGEREEDDEMESRITLTAYAAEDVIESHIVDQIHAQSTCHGENISCLEFYQGLERVIHDMDLIKKEVIDMGVQHHQLLSMVFSVSIGPVGRVSMMQNNTVVDFGDILIDVMDKLTRIDCDLDIVPIVGMGGSGKTTLATHIYASSLIVQHFDILSWVTLSEEYSVREMLLRVLSEENNVDEMCEDHEIGERVHKKLWGRRYLIVMDDIWSIEAWDKVKYFFPNNNNGSKIMITTRNSNLAFQLSGSHNFQMKFLDDDKSWDLLRKIVFGKESCPIELENIGKEIARSCRGLPLSIVVVGGLLTKANMTHEYWESTLQNLNSHINLENNEHCLQILRRSYKELPIHIKPCFLYMGVFLEDWVIHVSDLINLWVAEGILKPMKNKSLEQVAKANVKELVERNLIIVEKLRWNGKAKSCKIHDLLRDLCLREARKQRLLCVINTKDQNILKDVNMERRICIHHKARSEFTITIESAPHTRSLISFIGGYTIDIPPPSFSCRLLRVHSCFKFNYNILRIYGEVEALFKQANLRYLSLEFLQKAERLPTSWYHLWNLQTFDVRIYRLLSDIAIAPSEFWKMCHLRQVKFFKLQLPEPSSGEDDDMVLENLHTLSGIHSFKCSEEVVKRIPNVRKLKLFYDGYRIEKEGMRSFSLNNLCLLRNLKSLQLDFGYHDEDFPCSSDVEIMKNISLPHSFKKMSLCCTMFLWEDMTSKIGSLPLLEVLKLKTLSCVGSKWETVEGLFRSLKFLLIEVCDLKYWTSDNTHFPCLEHLVLRGLSKLNGIPLSIGDIPTLQSIQLKRCSESAYVSALRIKEEQLSLGNEDLQLQIDSHNRRSKDDDDVLIDH